MVQIQFAYDYRPVFHFVEAEPNLLQLVLRMRNRLNVAIMIVLQEDVAGDAVHHLRMSEVVGFQHVDKKMDRGPRRQTDAVKYLVECGAVTGEHLGRLKLPRSL